jgi:hypothetical protein
MGQLFSARSRITNLFSLLRNTETGAGDGFGGYGPMLLVEPVRDFVYSANTVWIGPTPGFSKSPN